MDPSSSQSGILKLLLLLTTCILGLYSTTSYATSSLHPLAARSLDEHLNYTAISDFRVVNRRKLLQCPDPNPYLQITVSPNAPIADVEYLTVTVSGVLIPDSSDWVAMISPSTANVTDCPSSEAYYLQTGDTSSLSLLCQYPVKAQYVSNDPNYLSCTNTQCQVYHLFGNCIVTTCNGTITFQVVNRRTDIEFVFSAGGFDTPCILARSSPLAFANPNMPLNGHLSSIDSSGASMRLTWVSGNGAPQQVQYGNGMSQTSVVSTFTQADMCSDPALPSPAVDFGWHDPGFIHSAVMKGLQPSSTFFYRYGRYLLISDKVVQTPYMLHPQPGSISVTNAVTDQVSFLVEWDFFLSLINPVASKISYMTAIGNPERDYANSGSVYIVTADSGGECGVAYETYFQMPTPAMDKPWYSIEEASVHFTVISTEHNWSVGLANESYLLSYIVSQYNWMAANMASVDRSKTPWLVFMGHRPMYTSSNPTTSVDPLFVAAVEPLLLQYKRTCAVYQGQCLAMPTKDANGTDTYDNTNYSAPVQAIIVMAGFSLDNFTNRTSEQDLWTLMTGKTSAVVGSIIKQSEFSEFWRILHLIWTPNVDGRTHSTECPFTRAQCMLLLGQQTRIDFPLYMFELIMDEAWEIKEYSLPYGVFLTQFLISRGVVIAASDTRKEVKSALNKFTLSRSRGQEGALTRRFARRAAAAVEEASRPSTSASEAPMETGAPAVPPPWVAQLFADLDSRVSATMKATLQPVERQMQSLEEQLKELGPPSMGSAL
ncbi:putative inactive purple acid phosphatase 1 [Morella rubra]|uniref:Putative inactive purple acid phosphatase 1 n=1 Tax=Morella rubra TaxID=262757 RepID=A0A6A1WLF0_9ROSI|nr:putative inactive purple acid phosphatase 1 [Morella rubra]